MIGSWVDSLGYAVSSDKHTIYKNPPTLEFENLLGKFRLADGFLTVWPLESFSSLEAAQAAIASFLRSWETHVALRQGFGTLRFTYNSGRLVDVPRSGGSFGIIDALTSTAVLQDSLDGTVTRQHYPDPPTDFRITPEVELAARRWENYKAGREPLPAAAYVIYTVLVPPGRRRKDAAALFNVDDAVLSKLSELSSTRGSAENVRKIQDINQLPPQADNERAWIEAALPLLIHRMGEVAAGATPSRITLSDLPTI